MAEITVEELAAQLVGHCKVDGDGVYVGRGYNGQHMLTGSVGIGERGWLGNPYEIGADIVRDGEVVVENATREAVVEQFEEVFIDQLRDDAEFRNAVEGLAGEPLNCWCTERGEFGPACHGQVIAKWALLLANHDLG